MRIHTRLQISDSFLKALLFWTLADKHTYSFASTGTTLMEQQETERHMHSWTIKVYSYNNNARKITHILHLRLVRRVVSLRF